MSAALVLTCVACGEPDGPAGRLEPWPEADDLFRLDPRFIGADGAYSIDLHDGRVLWMFGDTFIAQTPEPDRDEAFFVNNTVAIQHGVDPTNSLLAHSWRSTENGGFDSFFTRPSSDTWIWPGHGVRVDDDLLLFGEVVGTPADEPTGFEGRGWTAWRVPNSDAAPLDWQLVAATLPKPVDNRQLGEALIDHDGFVYAFGTRGSPRDVILARWPRDAARTGDLGKPQWWDGHGFSTTGDAAALLSTGAPEFSVHFDPTLEKWVMLFSAGFGATTIAARSAPELWGPWSGPRDLLRPPESFEPHAFVYAAKAHPHLRGAPLIGTYVATHFDDKDVSKQHELDYYFPRFVRGLFK